MKINFKKKELHLTPTQFEDITLVVVGEEPCLPSHSHGPKSRDPFLFHYIFSGTGRFSLHGKTYQVNANQGFLIPDDSVIYYETSEENPWHYGWIQIKGQGAQFFFDSLALSSENPIYTAKKENNLFQVFKNLINQANQTPNNPFTTRAALYSYLGELIQSNIHSNEHTIDFKMSYMQNAELYIVNNAHSETFRINDVAKYVGIDRSYLTRLFKQYYNLSPQEYLMQYRMNKAQHLIKNTTTPINIVAASVGYVDEATFSRIYKKYFGNPPSKDRKK